MPTRRVLPLLGLAAILSTAFPAVAGATPKSPPPFLSATFNCPGSTVEVEGRFKGNAFHLVSHTANFIVTHGELDGQVVFDVPGQAGRADLVTCSYTAPTSGRLFTVTGFFTPRA